MMPDNPSHLQAQPTSSEKSRLNVEHVSTSNYPIVDIENLRSNRLPTTGEASQTRAFLEAETLALQRIEEEIKRVDSPADLEVYRDALNEKIQRRRSWISPIRRLPVEILEEIFAHGVCPVNFPDVFSLDIISEVVQARDLSDSDTDSSSESSESESDSPRSLLAKRSKARTCVLSHVSHHWRKVAKSSPRLWSSLALDVTRMDEQHAALIDLYLSNSAGHPLQLCLYVNPDIVPFEYYRTRDQAIRVLGQTGFNILCTLIQKELCRCSDIYFPTSTEQLLAIVGHGDNVVHDRLPFLTYFRDAMPTGSINPNARWFWESIKTAPNLRRLTVDKQPKLEYLPDRLRSLHVVDAPDFFSLLSRVSQIESLRVELFSGSESDPIPNVPSISFPHLRHLYTRTPRSLADLDVLFDACSTPSLTSVEVDVGGPAFRMSNSLRRYLGYRHLDIAKLPTLQLMLQRSSCSSVQDLNLHMPFSAILSECMVALLHSMPNLVRFTLDYMALDKESSILPALCSILKLTARDGRRFILPRLQKLAVRELWQAPCPYDVDQCISTAEGILTMLEARLSSNPIKDISVVFVNYFQSFERRIKVEQPTLPSELSQRVQALERNGMQRCSITLPQIKVGVEEVVEEDLFSNIGYLDLGFLRESMPPLHLL